MLTSGTATDGGAAAADERRLHLSREWIAPSATTALWAVPVIVGLRAQALLGDTTSRAAATELFGAQSGKYFGYCPLPLILYFACAMLVRHAVAFVVAWRVRSGLGVGTDWRGPTLRLAIACGWWAALAVAGALVVAVAAGPSDAGEGWTLEVAFITAVAGLPCLALATGAAALAPRSVAFWLVTPVLLAVLALFSFGLHGSAIPVVVPGRIEIALTSGVEALQTRALVGALGWLAGTWVIAVACAFVRRRGQRLSSPRPGG